MNEVLIFFGTVVVGYGLGMLALIFFEKQIMGFLDLTLGRFLDWWERRR